jgi:hypothetical protein
LTARPCFFISAFMICVTSGTQPPHDVPAPVHDFSAPRLVAPSATAAQICAFDVVARADLRAVRQRVDAERGLRRAVRRRQDQELRLRRQLDAVQHHLQQRAVFGASPTITAPSRNLPQSDTTSFL